MAGGRNTGSLPPSRGFVLLVAGSFEGGLALLWVVLGRFFGMAPADQGEITALALGQAVAATFPPAVLLAWLVRSRLSGVRRLMAVVDETLVPFLSRLQVADFALIALLAGVGEEGLFRGLLQGGLARVMPPPAALIAAAALFGLLHFITPAYAVLAAVLGGYLGWLYLATGNVVVPMAVHALYDFIALFYLVRIRGAGGAGRLRDPR